VLVTNPRVRLRPVAAIVPYRQGRTAAADAFKLSSNENPYPPLPSVTAVLADVEPNRYPDGAATAVREAIGSHWQVSPEAVHVAAGSVAILGNLIAATCAPGDSVLYAWRSFEGYPLLAATAGVESIQVPLTADARHDLPAMAAAIAPTTRLVLLCSPNNPTGTTIRHDEFEAFMREVPPTVLVVLDEAYAEFVTDPDAVRGEHVLATHPNVVVLRTFSKAYGLAGLRIGYMIGAEYVCDGARAVSVPLSVTDLAQRAAIASLEHEDELLARVEHIVARRERIRDALIEQGWDVPQAQGNFVWLPTGDATLDAAAVFERGGIIVRALGEGIRISIGEEEAVEKLLRSAQEVVDALRLAPSDRG
jgi:histidinol-phosphate aminotransferase